MDANRIKEIKDRFDEFGHNDTYIAATVQDLRNEGVTIFSIPVLRKTEIYFGSAFFIKGMRCAYLLEQLKDCMLVVKRMIVEELGVVPMCHAKRFDNQRDAEIEAIKAFFTHFESQQQNVLQ